MLSNAKESSRRPQVSPQGWSIRGRKVAILGDSGGIGRATATQLLEQGAHVLIGLQDASELNTAFAALAQTGGWWNGMVVDLQSPIGIKAFFNQAEQRLGHVDALVNCISPGYQGIPVTGQPGAMVDSQCVIEAIARMQGRGRLVMVISNRTGDSGIPAHLRYQASEAGIHITLVETAGRRENGHAAIYLDAEETARCIVTSLAQPFPVDMVYVPGQLDIHML